MKGNDGQDALTQAQESLREYWEWEAELETTPSVELQKKIEEGQQWLLQRTKVAALVSIAESLAVLAEKSKNS